MRTHLRWLVVALILSAAGCAEPITHNEELAMKRAEEFAEIALVKQNFDRAYEQMSSKARSYLPLQSFKEAMIGSHQDGYPKTIKATSVRPIKDASTIFVILRGQDGAGKVFEYQIMLNGSAKSGYEVSTIRRLS
ncbi:MAG TPA: hypothetical protein VGH50_04600 [Candidatus Binatia bacterium]|jgi:hypothetical protein